MKRRGKQTEYQTAIRKFLEESKEPVRRLKFLKHGLEKSSLEEVKKFYTDHSSTIFYVVYGSFTQVEHTIIDRAARGKGYSETVLRDLVEIVLPQLEQVIVLLPEMINKRWQYNSICFIIKKLLHPENHKKLRQYGIKLLTLWVQALQENANDACMELFASAVPHFPPRKTPEGLPVVNPASSLPASRSPTSGSAPSGLSDRYGVYTTSKGEELTSYKYGSNLSLSAPPSAREVVNKQQLPPLHPSPPSDRSDEAMTLELMEYMLKCLTSQVDVLYWDDPSNYVRGFAFLFFSFKLFYLACLYKDFRSGAGLYSPSDPPEIKLPSPESEVRCKSLDSVDEEGAESDQLSSAEQPPAQKKLSPSLQKRRRTPDQFRLSTVIKLDYDLSDPIYTAVKNLILKYVLMWVLPSNSQQRSGGISGSPAPSPMLSRRPKFVPSGVELMRDMWFTSRDNVSMLLEICRHGFQTPLMQTYTLRKLVELYFHWEQTAKKPLFMQEPPVRSVGEVTSDLSTATPTPATATPPDQHKPVAAGKDDLGQTPPRPTVLSWEQLSGYSGFQPRDVQAGLQASLRMFVVHTHQIFFRETANYDELMCQVELCRKVIRLYQDIAQSWDMNKDTWEYMLAVILHITLELLRGGPPDDRESTLGGVLANTLLKTLLVCYLRASMVFSISPQLWDNLLAVLSSLTQWKEVVVQWKQIMDSITQVLAQTVYDLNMLDLPLDRLELEETHRLPKIRNKSQDHIISASPRTSSFTTINIPSLRRDLGTYTPPVKYPRIPEGGERSTSSMGDVATKRKIMFATKSQSEYGKDSPPMVPAMSTAKRSSMPDPQVLSKLKPRHLLQSAVPTIEEEAGPPRGESPERGESPLVVPRRSSSSIGQATRKLSDGGDLDESARSNLLAPGPISSPGATSLPPEMLFDAIQESGESTENEPLTSPGIHAKESDSLISADDRSLPMSEKRDVRFTLSTGSGSDRNESEGGTNEEDGSVIRNAHAKSMSPEPVPDTPTDEKSNLIKIVDRTKPVSSTSTPTRGSKVTAADGGGKGHSKAKEGSKWFPWRSQTIDRRRAKSVHGVKPSVAPGDLILTNKGFAKDSTPEPKGAPKYNKKKLCRSDSDTSDLRSKAEAAKEAKSSKSEEIFASEEKVTRTPLYRSLSDSNIPVLLRADAIGSPPSSSLNATTLDSSNLHAAHTPLRRVVSSGATPPRNRDRVVVKESMHDKVLDNEFSSAIIPHSHDGMLKQQILTSPARLSAAKLQRSLTVSEECFDEANGRVLPAGEEEGRQQASKSPPILVLTSTSPVQMTRSPVSSPHSGGWTPVVAAVIWCRMLRILGDVNDIKDPYIHSEAIACLQDMWKALFSMSINSGIAIGTQPTPPLPVFMPPLSLLLPWVVKACSMPLPYESGRHKAYQLLCEMTIYHWHTPPSSLYLTHFYRLLHAGLQPTSDVLPVAVKYCTKLFSHGLSGSSILLTDCINACSAILSQRRSSDPRTEALHLLGSMLFLPELYSNDFVPNLSSDCDGGSASGVGGEVGGASVGVATPRSSSKGVRGKELREKIIDILFESAKKEPMRICRCAALYQLGMLIYSELTSGRPSSRLPEGIEILLASLQFADRTVAMSAVDVICLLLEVSVPMKQLYPSIPAKVLEALSYAIAVFMKDDVEKMSWVDKIVVTLIHCLRDWLVTLPIREMILDGSLRYSTVNSIFEILQIAAGSSSKQSTVKSPLRSKEFVFRNPVSSIQLLQLDTVNTRSPRGQSGRGSRNQISVKRSGEDVRLSLERSQNNLQDEDKVQTAARSVLTHLLNLLGHFPFGCGAAQMSSVVTEYHDCPSLQHLDELSTEIFDSPRAQFFSFNNTAVVTLVEIPTKMEGIPSDFATASYQTRIIVRDVTGKYTWDCTVLYGPETSSSANVYTPLMQDSDSTQSESGLLSSEVSDITLGDNLNMSPGLSPLEPPSWRTHANTDRDVLEDLLYHIEATSPECILFPGEVGLCEPVPVGGGDGAGGGASLREAEEKVVMYLTAQHSSEQMYTKEAFTLPSMKGEKASAPTYFPNTLPFHYCRVFLSHLGMFSWAKRSHLDLLEKNNQLILELKHLDSIQTQSRQTYKVAVLYVAPGQEDKMSILSNSHGGHQYEDFIAGLGWEVEMKSHRGYMGGLKKEFCSNCSLPYYATSSEEVLFHVATRMPLKVDQIIRHLGNDEVHIVWSEHWRDYRRTIFKTQFADVLIIVYPLPTGLFRIQIQKKPNVPLFGPLFDGAVVDRTSLSPLVRATALNALRAQRSPLIGYRGRYEERMKYIRTLTDGKLQSSFEAFAENVMHPLEMSSRQTLAASTNARASPHKMPSSQKSMIAAPASIQSQLNNLGHGEERLSVGGIFRQAFESLTSPQRPRSSTNDERMLHPHSQNGANASGMHRNKSMPDQLNELPADHGRHLNAGSPHVLRSGSGGSQSSPRSSKYNLSDSHILASVRKKMHLKTDT